MEHWLVIVPHYWGKSNDLAAAWARVREESGKPTRVLKAGPHQVYRVHPESYCEGIRGGIVHPKDHPPRLVASKE